ncbi:hypothetical protein PIB30_076418 [Stylosanthes scabra]|uniref:(+)-neomenthol dehydrogenase-like n=1 Tax=Stylosanthes scabra TaxID=79078 RepID=A0ABU6WPY4_9FABA|nr:hypothetical protein [Stylosanthes scabra]
MNNGFHVNRNAVVTGANKGIGFGICKQLASNGITVILTARDEKRGLEALQNLKDLGLSGHVLFHQLDVTDANSIASLASFIKTHFGKLDILVNNAGITGAVVDHNAFIATLPVGVKVDTIDWRKIVYEYAEAGIRTNYYGVKGMCEALLPFLQ